MERATFFDRLRLSRVLSDADLERAASQFGDDDKTQDIADSLMREGLLTPFQVRQVCGGDTQPLTLGQYRLLDELGRGGMGRVYKALHTIMGRTVAIKVISPDLVRNPIAVEWFRREVRATTQLVHPNIVMAYDANEADGLHFLVMEYVRGETLDALVKKNGPLPVNHACALMRQAALGLQSAHEKGMVHRDIKPGNLLVPHPDSELADDVLVKIVDFGLARLQNKISGDTIALRADADVLGTPDYISPEQSRDIHAADIRSDLYSLGCVFYYALAGRVPFLGETAMEKLIKHMMDEAEPLERVSPATPPDVVAIVRRLMAKNPADRYQTPAELVRDLDAWFAERPKLFPTTKTACRSLWISPPTPVPPNRVSSEHASHTKVIDAVEVFAELSPPPLEPSGPSLFEPLWKHAPCEVRQVRTHDTLPLPLPSDTEPSTAVATALEKRSEYVPTRSDDTFEEMCASVGEMAPHSEPSTNGAAAPPRTVDAIVRRHWRRWTALVETIVQGRGAARVSGDAYRTAHALVLQACRSGIESATTPERRAFYQELVSIVQPWLSLHTFAHTDANMLASLLENCKRTEWELNDGKVPWTMRQGVGLVMLLFSPIGLAVWYWNYGRVWLPAMGRSIQWGSSSPSLRSIWAFVETHPAILMGVIFPLAVVYSVYLLSSARRG